MVQLPLESNAILPATLDEKSSYPAKSSNQIKDDREKAGEIYEYIFTLLQPSPTTVAISALRYSTDGLPLAA